MDRRHPKRPNRNGDQRAYVAALEQLVDELLGQIDWLWTELQLTRIKAGLDPVDGRPRRPSSEARGADRG